jgi:autotransporter-associated beta strand protein
MLQTGTLVLAGVNAAGSEIIEQSVNAGPSLLQIGATGTITNNMTVQNLLATQSATLTLSGSLFGSDTNALTKTGNGTLALNGNIPFSGEINVNSGTLIGSSTNLSGLRQNNGTVEFLQNTNGSMSNSISGTGSVTKSGTGNLTLSGSNSFTGNTTINTGKLLVNGSLGASSSVSVAAGATLGGSGTIGGSVAVQGTVSPGASIESLSVGGILFDDTSTFDYEIDSSAASAVAGDLLVVTGDIDIVAGAAIAFSDLSQTPAAFAQGTILSLVNYGGDWNGGFFSLNGTSLGQGDQFTTGGTVWSIDYTATSGGLNFASDHITGKFINVTAVPEPSTYALHALGVLVWAGFAVRRRNRGLPTQ